MQFLISRLQQDSHLAIEWLNYVTLNQEFNPWESFSRWFTKGLLGGYSSFTGGFLTFSGGIERDH